MQAHGEAGPGGTEEGREGRLGKCSRGSSSADSVSGRRRLEEIKAYLVRTIESEKGIHTCQGRLRIRTTFYASFGLDDVEQLLEGALEREKLLDVLILRNQQLPETNTFCKRQCQAIRASRRYRP